MLILLTVIWCCIWYYRYYSFQPHYSCYCYSLLLIRFVVVILLFICYWWWWPDVLPFGILDLRPHYPLIHCWYSTTVVSGRPTPLPLLLTIRLLFTPLRTILVVLFDLLLVEDYLLRYDTDIDIILLLMILMLCIDLFIIDWYLVVIHYLVSDPNSPYIYLLIFPLLDFSRSTLLMTDIIDGDDVVILVTWPYWWRYGYRHSLIPVLLWRLFHSPLPTVAWLGTFPFQCWRTKYCDLLNNTQ